MEMQNYTVEDFICDDSFQHFCKGDRHNDLQFWKSWIQNHPEKSEEITEAIRMVAVLSAKQGNLEVQRNILNDSIQRLGRLKETLGTEDRSPDFSLFSTKRKKYGIKYLAGIAATLLLVALGGVFFFKSQHTKTIEENVATENQKFDTKSEARKTIILTDGSIITLHSNSSITLIDGFNSQNRELTLSGEAFFDIKHNPKFPFKIHTANLDIQVMGTIFNVKAYPDSAQTETSLFTGKVMVSFKDPSKKKIILKPNEKMIFDNQANTITTKVSGSNKVIAPFYIVPASADSLKQKSKELSWVHNRLKIDDEPFSLIAEKLQKWYGINIVFSDEKVKGYRYTGTFESETVVQALEALQLSYPFTFKINNKEIIISQ